MKKSTQELLDLLYKTTDFDNYAVTQKSQFIATTLAEQLQELLDKRGVEKSDVIKESGIDRTYAYQIFSGAKKPSRDKLLALCIAMHLDGNEIQSILKCNHYAILYPKHKRDSFILFATKHQKSLYEINEFLFDMEMELLQ